MAELTTEKRNKLAGKSFVFPKDRRYPIPDLAHAKNALARSSGKPEQAAVRAAVYKKFPALAPDSKADEDTHEPHALDGMKPKGECEDGTDATREPHAHEWQPDTAYGSQDDMEDCRMDEKRGPGKPDEDGDDEEEENEEDGERTDVLNLDEAFPGEVGGEVVPPLPELAAKESEYDQYLNRQDHPLNDKVVRLLPGLSTNAQDGGRVWHGHLGRVLCVEPDSLALVHFSEHGLARVPTDWLCEAKVKPEPETPAAPQPTDGVHTPSTGARADNADGGMRKGVLRFDRGQLSKPVKMDNGWVRCEGAVGRSGFLEYRTDDGKPWIEYRPPEEAFHADTLASFDMVPLTNDHPPANAQGQRLLTAENTHMYQVGTVSEPKKLDERMVSKILVTHGDAWQDMEDGKIQLSCGYTADVECTPGSINGQRYDAIQRNVRGNHVALVNVGRAGPEACVRMDSLSAEVLTSKQAKGSNAMAKVRIDNVDYDVSESAVQAIDNWRKRQTAAAEKLTARVDALEAENKKLRADVAAAPKAAEAAVKARFAVEQAARQFLGADVKLDGMSITEIKRLAVEQERGTSLEGKSEAYVDAAFDLLGDAPAGSQREEPTTSRLDVSGGLAGDLAAYNKRVEEASRVNPRQARK